ncbi:MAG TPA: methionyl-tRNA formyltransferase [Bacteroidales bacterium]|nr:methionyl-tRNA formyltransferase [Bacteroidales bacterium]HOL97009.1 methionyl-tRNA formyltransferase [Bacteroidales bacterium]HOM36274.1 methionyl-tRNA formyltransferase [Bacteroidales bacterium]HPD23802.1 methionyl-tRNA formyltransferase [Bacteroidales bacterium]HRS98694.1 methionyl-tRNA formyltransferase [Bacteroidales bacterium]
MTTKINDLKIIYMGTPQFAVAPLKSLLENDFKVVAVVTAPDKPAGRGKKLKASEVKVFAEQHNLKILQPNSLKDPKFLKELKELNANLFIVVAFRMLPKIVWEIPKFGTFNIHASLLPDYRGAAPINHVLINGEKVTGLTSFFINEEIDSGNIILKKECLIEDEDNFGTLHDKLMHMSESFVIETIKIICSENFNPKPQSELLSGKELHLAPKITKEFCQIDFNKSSISIHNFIRGLSPYPGAYTFIEKDVMLKIFKSEYKIENQNLAKPGTIITDNKNFLIFSTVDGYIEVLDLQISGRKRMQIKEFLNGYKFNQ